MFLVESQRDDGWVNVLLPVRPAGTTGWVRDSDVTITQVVYRMRVELAAGRLTVFSRGKQLTPVPIAIDAAARATKPGALLPAGVLHGAGGAHDCVAVRVRPAHPAGRADPPRHPGRRRAVGAQ